MHDLIPEFNNHAKFELDQINSLKNTPSVSTDWHCCDLEIKWRSPRLTMVQLGKPLAMFYKVMNFLNFFNDHSHSVQENCNIMVGATTSKLSVNKDIQFRLTLISFPGTKMDEKEEKAKKQKQKESSCSLNTGYSSEKKSMKWPISSRLCASQLRVYKWYLHALRTLCGQSNSWVIVDLVRSSIHTQKLCWIKFLQAIQKETEYNYV